MSNNDSKGTGYSFLTNSYHLNHVVLPKGRKKCHKWSVAMIVLQVCAVRPKNFVS